MSHTQGEWKVEVWQNETSIEGEHYTIASDVSNEDAHLIAAAPDMYKALHQLIGDLDTDTNLKNTLFRCNGSTLGLIEIALAKAEGR